MRRKRKWQRRQKYSVGWNVNPSFDALGDALVEGFKLLSPEEREPFRRDNLEASRRAAAAAKRAIFHRRTGMWVN